MANKFGTTTLEADVLVIDGYFTLDTSTNVIKPTDGYGFGISSVNKTGTGAVDIVLSRTYSRFLGGEVLLQGAATSHKLQLAAFNRENVGTVKLLLVSTAGSATNPAATVAVYATLRLRN